VTLHVAFGIGVLMQNEGTLLSVIAVRNELSPFFFDESLVSSASIHETVRLFVMVQAE
jgi:hypothetical protein